MDLEMGAIKYQKFLSKILYKNRLNYKQIKIKEKKSMGNLGS
jgi:hypothetical protein